MTHWVTASTVATDVPYPLETWNPGSQQLCLCGSQKLGPVATAAHTATGQTAPNPLTTLGCMGRRDRSRSRGHERRRRSSSSSSSTYSSSDEESEIAKEERAERKEQREEQRRADRKLREEKAKQEAAERKAGEVQWIIKDTINTYDHGEDDDDDDDDDNNDDASIFALRGIKLASAPLAVQDCKSWGTLEPYLRGFFEVHTSQKKVALKLKLMSATEVEGGDILYGTVRDESTMANWWVQLTEAVERDGPSQKKIIKAELVGVKGAIKIARKKKPVTARATAEKEKFNSLVTAIYGEQPGHYAEGEWSAEASDIVRRDPAMLKKYLAMRKLTAKVRGRPALVPPVSCSTGPRLAGAQVMGCADYLPNMCVIVCPFDGGQCSHGVFRMNGSCKPSQVPCAPAL
jgi:hypothetical protein